MEKALRGGANVAELKDAPELPEGVSYIWQWFHAIARRRTSSGFGPNPITHQDIVAYAQLYRVDIDPWEAELICSIDDLFLASLQKKEGKDGRDK